MLYNLEVTALLLGLWDTNFSYADNKHPLIFPTRPNDERTNVMFLHLSEARSLTPPTTITETIYRFRLLGVGPTLCAFFFYHFEGNSLYFS